MLIPPGLALVSKPILPGRLPERRNVPVGALVVPDRARDPDRAADPDAQ
jgi:hypothetical protein